MSQHSEAVRGMRRYQRQAAACEAAGRGLQQIGKALQLDTEPSPRRFVFNRWGSRVRVTVPS